MKKNIPAYHYITPGLSKLEKVVDPDFWQWTSGSTTWCCLAEKIQLIFGDLGSKPRFPIGTTSSVHYIHKVHYDTTVSTNSHYQKVDAQISVSRNLCSGICVQESASWNLCPEICVQESVSKNLCPGICLGICPGICLFEINTPLPNTKLSKRIFVCTADQIASLLLRQISSQVSRDILDLYLISEKSINL